MKMVHHSKKKMKSYRQYDDKVLEEAVQQVKSKEMSARQASQVYGIPRTTIGDYLRGKSLPGCHLGRPPVLPPKVEETLVEKVKDAASRGFGFSRKELFQKRGLFQKYGTTSIDIVIIFYCLYKFSS